MKWDGHGEKGVDRVKGVGGMKRLTIEGNRRRRTRGRRGREKMM